MLLETSAMENTTKKKNGEVKGVLWKNVFLGDLLRSQYLFEILQASLTVQNRENTVKSGCFEKRL